MENNIALNSTNRGLIKKRRKERLIKILAMAFVYFVLLLMYAPIIYITIFSFTEHTTTGIWDGFSFGNYINLFNYSGNRISQNIWNAVGNTALVAVTSAFVSTILGTLGAIGIFYTRKKQIKNTLDFVTQIPVVNAEIVTAVSLCILFVICQSFLPRSFITLVIGHVVLSVPYVVMSVKPKLEQMDPSLYEAAMDLGATHVQALWKVTIPDIIPGILSGFLLSITLSLDDYVITVFTKPTTGNFETISTYVDAVTKRSGLPAQIRAFTAILFAVILIVMVLMNVRSSRNAKKIYRKGD
ncbi:MAG TPA: ABC transporter permease [Erysipelotrichaceae bacterium]|nr:ABC transporter permease [Erysipelotrichaceae bacterium]